MIGASFFIPSLHGRNKHTKEVQNGMVERHHQNCSDSTCHHTSCNCIDQVCTIHLVNILIKSKSEQMNQSKEATPSTLEKSFFSDYTNSRIVTLHMQGKTKKQIIRAIGKSDHTQEVSQRHISWVVNRYEMYMRVYKHADITTARQGHKNEPYYQNEVEHMIKCVVPMSAAETLILVKKEHIDSNYKKFIARS